MKAKFLKIAGVKSEKEFYKKYPTEAAFFKAHPEAKELKKAKIGSYIGGEQDVVSQHQSYEDYANLVPMSIVGKTQDQMKAEQERQAAAQAAQQGGGGMMNVLQGIMGAIPEGKKGKKVKKAYGGWDSVGALAGQALSGIKGKGNISKNIAQGLPAIGGIVSGIQAIGAMKKQRKELETAAKISDIALQASRTQPERKQRRYVRPEDAVVSPNERFIPGGTGTEILAEYGASIGGNPTEIQNMYNPGDLYSNLGYEPLSDSDVIKQYRSGGLVPKAVTGFESFMAGGGGAATSNLLSGVIPQTGGIGAGSQIGGGIGEGIGMAVGGPAGAMIGKIGGQLQGALVGGILDAKGAKKQKRNEDKLKQNTETMATESSIRGALGNYSSFVKNGGDIPYAENGWMSHDWQPQVIAKWGDVNVEDVDDIFRPADMRTLEHGGLLKAQNGLDKTLPKDYRSRWNDLSEYIRGQVGYDPKNPKGSAERLRGMPETQAFIKQYNESHPDAPFDPSWVPHVQKEFAETILPRDKAFAERRGMKLPEKDLSAYEGIIGYRTAGYRYPDLVEVQGGGQENPLGIIGEGFSQDYGSSYTDQGGQGGSSSMRGLTPGKIILPGGSSAKIEFLGKEGEKKPYFRNPSTGDLAPYDPNKYHADTGRYYRTGGNIRQNYLSELDQYNFGGNLKTHWGGRAEVDSYNPYLPGTGETVMFKGNQHSESDGKGNTGIGVSYGPQEHDSYTDYAEYGSEQAADVEVENGEPAAQLPDANGDLSMTVFGALKIDKNAAMEIGDDEAKGLTYKKYVDRLNDKENKANTKLAKANEQLENLKVVTPFDRLKLNSLQSTIQGENDKLKDYAVKKVTAAEVQNAYNETAEEYGIDADALAKGKIKPSKDMNTAKHGIKKAQPGINKPAIPTVGQFLQGFGINLPKAEVIDPVGRIDSIAKNLYLQLRKHDPFAKIETGYTDNSSKDTGKKTSSEKAKPAETKNKSTKGKGKAASKSSPAASSKSTTSKPSPSPKVPLVLQSAQNAAVDPKDPLGLNKILPVKEESYVQSPYSRESYEQAIKDVAKGFQNYRKSKSVDGGFKADRPTAAVKSDTRSTKTKRKKEDKQKDKIDWKEFAQIAFPQLANILRRPLQEDLDPRQLYPEMLAKTQNQLQPVQAQTFQPLLDTPFDVSFQDQLNQNQATFNALQRQIGANPAALSALAAQKYSADKQVLADQFRTNQALRAGVFSKNRDTLNDAALKNLAILDQQYTRQAEAISKTKATDLEIAKSISDKIAKNRLENRQFAAMSNMFPQYGFNRNMMAFSQAPTFFSPGMVPGLSPEDAKSYQEWYDQKNKTKTETSTTGKYGKNLKKHFKNGSIVKSLKNI